MARGERILAHAASLAPTSDSEAAFDIRAALEGWTRARFWSLVHAATTARHRTLPDWRRFLAAHPDRSMLLRFLNNPEFETDDKTWANLRYYVEFCERGYLGLKLRWRLDAAAFDRECCRPEIEYAETKTIPEYRRDGPSARLRMAEMLRPLAASGTRVYLVRIPQYTPLDARQDALVDFDADMGRLAGEVGARYLPASIAPAGFRDDRDNFRDAEHLHHDSSRVYCKLLRAALGAP
jgi:hypothetical protein